MNDQLWLVNKSCGPIIAVANHNGHALRPEVESLVALNERVRLHNENPFTGYWAMMAPSYIVPLRSRFEVDLNRPRDKAIYLCPEDAWGMQVWKRLPSKTVIQASLQQYEAYYAALDEMCREKQAEYGRFVVLDLQSYNYRLEGAEGLEADPTSNPDVNISTGTIDRQYWGGLVDRLIDDLRHFKFLGHHLDVRENVKPMESQVSKWVQSMYPQTGCAITIQFKKFFMDEWTGDLDCDTHVAIKQAIAATFSGLEEELDKTKRPPFRGYEGNVCATCNV